ncbi:MAG TPA: MoxR family ATPase [Gemmatales bacterium]|nr:MoxR family ATPase [Gemmatales bacterium]
MSTSELAARAETFRNDYRRLKSEIGKVIVGQDEVVNGVLTCLFVGGHALLEGVPGLGKTLLVRTLAQVLDLKFARIQFTPDLMPSDIIGTNILVESEAGRVFRFQPGPLFAQMVLADEINRATPKTQSALLEAMQEHSVTVGGQVHRLVEPFFVMATQNPIEQEGTYPLPEAQLDRFFFKLLVPPPGRTEIAAILDRTTRTEQATPERVLSAEQIRAVQQLVREVLVAPPVQDYAIRLVLATHPQGEFAAAVADQYLRCGASPRGAQTLILAAKVRALLEGRYNVSFADLRAICRPSLRHRLLLNFEAQAEGIDADRILDQVLQHVQEQAELAA